MQTLEIGQIKDSILQLLPDAGIVLFGSRARGEATINSDVDLLIIVDKEFNGNEKLNLEKTIRRELTAQYKLAFDIIVQSKKVAAQKKKLLGHIVYYAMKEGVLL